MLIEEFGGSWRDVVGEILAAWFIANPSGPTAFAVGFLEREQDRVLFYRHLHFTGGKSWIASELSDEVAAHDGDFGGVLINTLLRLNNHFLVNGGDRIFLKEIPHVVITNGNLSVTSSFFEFIKLSTIEEDWGLFHALSPNIMFCLHLLCILMLERTTEIIPAALPAVSTG